LEPYFDLSPKTIESLLERARKTGSSEPPHLLGWYAVACGHDEAEELARALRGTGAVETAALEPGPPPHCTVTYFDDPREIFQDFHLPAPYGVDARYAWGFDGGDGSGVGFVDVERGWLLDNGDFGFDADSVLISGVNSRLACDEPEHGIATLGVVVAEDNERLHVGIAPRATTRLSSARRTAGGDCNNGADYNVASAIAEAAALMAPGDVLLVEVGIIVPLVNNNRADQRFLPVEAWGPAFDAVRAAVDAGIVVVEGAGNSDTNLDDYRRDDKAILDRSSPDFKDSGAIVVGAAFSGKDAARTPRARVFRPDLDTGGGPAGTVFGSRVDCFAWGDGVETAAPAGAGGFLISWSNTSAAAAIVAGVALSLQGIAQRTGARRTPQELRALLSDPALNTPSADPPVDRIGVMPDLRALIRRGLHVVADEDLMIRDFVGDDGSMDPGVVLGRSPDIVVSNTRLDDPQGQIGAAGTAPGLPVDLTDPCWVYLRAQNIGSETAHDVPAVVFWTPQDTLLEPARWKTIGGTAFATVPADSNSVTVSDPVRWDGYVSGFPGFGEYYLVAAVNVFPDDPMPWQWEAFADEAALRSYIGANNNIATRKITLRAHRAWPWWDRLRAFLLRRR
jgi:serine protease